jgi:hypothetical protein
MKNTFRFLLIAALITLLVKSTFAQDTVVAWNFPSNPDNAIADGGTPANLLRTIGSRGNTSTIDFANAGFTTNSANASGWDNGVGTKYWMISFNSTSFTSLYISSKQRSSNTGPSNFKLQYTLDTTGAWTDVPSGTITVLNNWTSGYVNTLQLPVACTNQPLVYIRWIMTNNLSVTGGTVANTGTCKIDDILVNGAATFIPTYASLPYQMNFESLWIDGNDIMDVPSVNWLNTPATGNNSWRREDNTSAWTSNVGAYTPSGALSTNHSARFHTWDTPAGTTGSLDLYIDCSTPGMKVLTFYYINNSGVDHSTILFSTDGGLSFTPLDSAYAATTWTKRTVSLGSTTSPTCIVRFRGYSDWGNDDFGLDQVSVGPPPANDAGISAIVSPASSVSGGNLPVKVNIKNYGTSNLVSASIHWSVNGVNQTTYPWTGNLASNAIDDSINLGNYNFVSGSYFVKAWTQNPNGLTDGDIMNDTAVKTIIVTQFATVPFYENFDGVWINKNDTADVPSVYWVNNPAAGNNSWRRDDEGIIGNWVAPTTGGYSPSGAFSTSHSARFHTYYASAGSQGLFNLYIDLSPAGSKNLSYYCINTDGTDSLQVLLSTDGGTTFSRIGSNHIISTWTKYTINLGAVVAPNCVIRFAATSDFGMTDIGLDEVSVSMTGHDLGIINVIQPVSGCNLSAAETVEVQIKNLGTLSETNIPVSCKINGSTINGTYAGPLNPGVTVNFTFTQTVNLSVPGAYNCTYYTGLTTDVDHTNDTVKNVITNTSDITSFPFYEDFESGNMYFALSDAANSGIAVQNGIGNGGSAGLRMTGGTQSIWPANSGSTTTHAQAWNLYTDHHARAYTCNVDATTLTSPELKLDLRQTYSTGILYSWFRVLINDTIQLTSIDTVSDFHPATTNADPFKTHIFDLQAYAGTNFKLTFQSSCKYDSVSSTVGDNVFLDNIIIREKPMNDISVTKWISPTGGQCGMGLEPVTIELTNAGVNSQTVIPVSYSIDNGNSWATDTIFITLLPGDTLLHTFTQTADFSIPATYHCLATGSLVGDGDLLNDTATYDLVSNAYVSAFPYFQNFESPNAGWVPGSPDGSNCFELGTPNKIQLNSAHSGVNSWVTLLSGDYPLNSDCWLVSPCFDFSSLIDPQLSVWLNINMETGWDAMVMETSINDSTWVQFAGNLIFYNNNDAMGTVIPPKWSGSNGGWTKYKTALNGFAGKTNVRIRFHFVSDYSVTGEGIAIDDINIYDPLPFNAAVKALVTPADDCDLGPAEIISVKVASVGTDTINNVSASFSLDGGTWHTENIAGPILPDSTTIHTFTTTGDFSTSGTHQVRLAVSLAGDLDQTNDSITVQISKIDSITSVPFNESFDAGNSSFALTHNSNGGISLVAGQGDLGTYALEFTGGSSGTWPSGSGYFTSSAEAWGVYTDHIASAATCNITLTGTNSLFLRFLLRQTQSGKGPLYSWFRVVLNGTAPLSDTLGVVDFNPISESTDSFRTVVYNLTPYMSTTFSIALQSSNKYSASNAFNNIGDNAYVDNLALYDTSYHAGIKENSIPFPVCYPNPTNGNLFVRHNAWVKSGSIEVYDISGKLNMKIEINESDHTVIEMDDLPKGLYCILLRTENGIATVKVVKQ